MFISSDPEKSLTPSFSRARYAAHYEAPAFTASAGSFCYAMEVDMGAGSEWRYLQMVRRQGEDYERERHLRACLRADRPARPSPPKPPRPASQRQVRGWMEANAEDYGGPTQLAEASACEYPEAADWLNDETHWIWDLAADQYDA